MKKWKLPLGVGLVLLCVVLTSAALRERGKEFKAMHKEMREYAKQNILPVMKEQRLKLDEQLSDEDKATIASIREDLHAGREAKREEMKKCHEQMKNGEIDHEQMRERFKAARAAMKEKMAPIEAIASKYESEIEGALDVAKANKETWKEGMENIRRKYISDEDFEKMKERRHGKRHHRDGAKEDKRREHHKGMHGKHHRGKMRGMHMKMMKKAFTPVGFLLWDPNAPIPHFDRPEFGEDAPESAEVYPNPSIASNKISFDVQEKGQVKIELLDKSGTLVKTILNDTKERGNHTIDVDLSTLPSAVYYYRITTTSGSKTTRFLIDK